MVNVEVYDGLNILKCQRHIHICGTMVIELLTCVVLFAIFSSLKLAETETGSG